jgi:hypothetical protein
VTDLRGKEAHLSARLAAWRRQAGREMTEARQRLEAVEASLDHLEQQADKEDIEEDTDRQGFSSVSGKKLSLDTRGSECDSAKKQGHCVS